MKHLKKIDYFIKWNNDKDNTVYYYYSTVDGKVEVLERDENVWFIHVGYGVDLNIDNAEHMLKEGTLEEMLKEGEKLYKLILKEENK